MTTCEGNECQHCKIAELQREMLMCEAWVSFHMEEIKQIKGNTPEAHALYKETCVKRNAWKVKYTTAKSLLVRAKMAAGIPVGTTSSSMGA